MDHKIVTRIGTLIQFLMSMTMKKTNNHGNWCATAHSVEIDGVAFSVHFERNESNGEEKLYFNGFDVYAHEFELTSTLGALSTASVLKVIGKKHTGYIEFGELREHFPSATVTCNFDNCPVHDTRLSFTPITEVPVPKEAALVV